MTRKSVLTRILIYYMIRRNNFVGKIANLIGGPRYDGKYLKSTVQATLGNLTVSQTLTNVVIPTFDLKLLQPIIFTTKDVNILSTMIATNSIRI